MTLVLVSHDLGDRAGVRAVVVLDAGKVAFDGPTADGLLFYHRIMEARDDEVVRA